MTTTREKLKTFFLRLGIISFISIAFFAVFFIINKQSDNDQNKKSSFNDGPYVFYLNDSLAGIVNIVDTSNKSVYKFSVNEQVVNYAKTPGFYYGGKMQLLRFNSSVSEEIKDNNEYPANKIAAISDIHGCYSHFVGLLKHNGIINDSLDWCWNEGHLVIVGDVFDKGPHVTECLWLIKKLEYQAETAGGRVHYLLGNHEIYILNGKTEHAGYKYRVISDGLLTGYDKLYSPDTELGRWLRSKKVIVKINDVLFVHAGISDEILEKNLTIDSINSCFHRWLNNRGLLTCDKKVSDLMLFLTGGQGPVEYRGYFNYNIFNRRESNIPIEKINLVLEKYKCSHIVVGHTPVNTIISMFDNKIIPINCKLPEDDSIRSDSKAGMLVIETNSYYNAFINNNKIQLFN